MIKCPNCKTPLVKTLKDGEQTRELGKDKAGCQPCLTIYSIYEEVYNAD